MARHVFYSLHYDGDRSRVSGLLASKLLAGQVEAKPDEWAKIQRSGDFAIKRWIENALKGRSCTVVLIGAQTATRPWVHYEIKRSHELGLGLLGVYVHQLKDAQGRIGSKGPNPFEQVGPEIASAVPVYEPPDADSKLTHRYIVDNLPQWAEEAVAARKVR